MNVFFHTLTAVGIAVSIIDTDSLPSKRRWAQDALLASICGVITHGLLDYIPHRYPLNSKVDVMISLLLMVVLILKSDKKYRLILAASFLGSILPDVIDLSAGIFNKYLHLNLPVLAKMFPWHWPEYSGSVYEGGYGVSIFDYGMIIMLLVFIVAIRWRTVVKVFCKN